MDADGNVIARLRNHPFLEWTAKKDGLGWALQSDYILETKHQNLL